MGWQWTGVGGVAALALMFVLAGASESGRGRERLVSAQLGPPPVAPSPNACVSGSGSRSWCGDGGAATAAKLAGPRDVTAAPDGTLFIADTLNNVIRRVTPDGVIATVAGDGVPDPPQPSEPAATAGFDQPHGVAYEAGGSLLVADTNNNAIRRVSADGEVTIVLGGRAGVAARLRRPRDVVALPGGAMLVVDSGNHRVLRVSARSSVRRLAGTGRPGFIRRSRRAAGSPLRLPSQVSRLTGGELLIADTGNRAVRVLSRGRLRTRAVLAGGRRPLGVAASGARVLASHGAGVVSVAPSPQAPVAGTGTRGFTGDTGSPLAVALDTPSQLAASPDGTLLIAEAGSDRVRRLRVGELVTVAGSDRPAAVPGAAQATAARARKCERYNPRFDPFELVGRRGSPLTSRGRKRLHVRYRTGRPAKVVAQVLRGSSVTGQARRNRARPGRNVRRLTVRGTFRRDRRYRVALWGSSFPEQLQKCSFKRLRIY